MGAGQVEAPVVVAVASGRPVGLPVNEDVGDCHAGVLGVAGDDVLAADEGGLWKWLACCNVCSAAGKDWHTLM